jgi:hypothetical protein
MQTSYKYAETGVSASLGYDSCHRVNSRPRRLLLIQVTWNNVLEEWIPHPHCFEELKTRVVNHSSICLHGIHRRNFYFQPASHLMGTRRSFIQ